VRRAAFPLGATVRRARAWLRNLFPLLLLACVVPVRVESECVPGEAMAAPVEQPSTMPTAAVVEVQPPPAECPAVVLDTPGPAICAKSKACNVWKVERVCVACVEFWFTINDRNDDWPTYRNLLAFADCEKLEDEARKTGMADCIAYHEGVLGGAR